MPPGGVVSTSTSGTSSTSSDAAAFTPPVAVTSRPVPAAIRILVVPPAPGRSAGARTTMNQGQIAAGQASTEMSERTVRARGENA